MHSKVLIAAKCNSSIGDDDDDDDDDDNDDGGRVQGMTKVHNWIRLVNK